MPSRPGRRLALCQPQISPWAIVQVRSRVAPFSEPGRTTPGTNSPGSSQRRPAMLGSESPLYLHTYLSHIIPPTTTLEAFLPPSRRALLTLPAAGDIQSRAAKFPPTSRPPPSPFPTPAFVAPGRTTWSSCSSTARRSGAPACRPSTGPAMTCTCSAASAAQTATAWARGAGNRLGAACVLLKSHAEGSAAATKRAPNAGPCEARGAPQTTRIRTRG